MTEFLILKYIVNQLEENGGSYKNLTFSLNQELVDSINKKYNKSYSLIEFQKAANKGTSHEWLCYSGLSDRDFRNLKLTQKGMGVAISKMKSDELVSSRSFFKKASDYIENHKGLFILLGFLITVATFTMKFTGDKL